MLIGLDCVPPSFAYERFASVMPCLSALRARGAWARLRSTFPPITVPAWAAMVSGCDPGELGVYGFRKRTAGGYGLSLIDSRDLVAQRVWDVLARAGKRSSVMFVPPAYPPFSVHGELVSCFLTPPSPDQWSHPRLLGGELAARFGDYIPDVDVRQGDRRTLLERLVAMTRQHFAMVRHVWTTREPDFLMCVEIGPDRLHHAFLADIDPAHPRHDPRSTYLDVGERYYRALDAELLQLVALADEDTTILVASDHGVAPLQGCFLVNAWLERAGYLVLREQPGSPGPLTPAMVDWSRTRAWAESGYYARIFVNVAGREPEGCVAPEDVSPLLDALTRALLAVRGPNGEAWCNRVERPAQLYRSVKGDAPDLCAIFDDLRIRALSTVGSGSQYCDRDDRGSDAANHGWHGIFVASGAGVSARGDLGELAIQDVGVTALALLGVAAPEGWLGVDALRSNGTVPFEPSGTR